MSIGIRYKFVENKTGSALVSSAIPGWDGEDRQMKVFVRHLSAADIGDTDGKTKGAVSGGCLIGYVENINDVLMIEGASYFRLFKDESKATEYELLDNFTRPTDATQHTKIHYNLMPNGEIRVLDASVGDVGEVGLEADDLVVVRVYLGAKYPGTNFKAYDPSVTS